MNESRNPYSNSTLRKMGVVAAAVRPAWWGEDDVAAEPIEEICSRCGQKFQEVSKGSFNPPERACGCPPWKKLAAIGWGR